MTDPKTMLDELDALKKRADKPSYGEAGFVLAVRAHWDDLLCLARIGAAVEANEPMLRTLLMDVRQWPVMRVSSEIAERYAAALGRVLEAGK